MPTPLSSRAPANLTLDGVVRWWALRTPDAPALRCVEAGAEDLSWSAMEARVECIAASLGSRVAPGTTIGVVCSTGIDFHVMVNALWRCGAAVLLIDRNWGPAIVQDLVRLVACKRIFAQRSWSAAGDAASLVEPYLEARAEAGKPLGWSPPEPDVDAVALYATTSGTTDNPKCVAISHRRIRAAYDCCLTVHDFSAVRRAACLFELNSLGILGICFLLPREVGAATTIYRAFSIANVARLWTAVLEERTDFIYLVPPMVRLLNGGPKRQREEGRWRLLAFCSAAPVAERELREFEARYPVETYNCYGLTELTFAVFFGARADDGGASESIGKPVGIEARLLDDAGVAITGPGRGELQIAGPMLTEGYLHNPSATALSWNGRWLKTGDLAERDAVGSYRICGRLKDVVLRGGYTYYLGELEHYLRRAPGVVDVCAFAGRDLPSGDELCVLVQGDGNAKPHALMDWIRDNMGPTKLPNALYVASTALPRNSNGKIDRNRLRRMHLDGVISRAGTA